MTQKSAGQKLVDALREAGFVGETIIIKPTPESIQRRRDVLEFIRKLNHLHEIAKNSKLRFGACAQSPI